MIADIETARLQEIRELKLQIELNEMLPRDLQCRDAITEMKRKLARLQDPRPDIRLVP